MLVSYNWLKKYVKLPDSVSPEELGLKLTLSTVEVEGIINRGRDLDKIVVGKVLSAEKHPDADKLKVCSVDVGKEKLKIVCGGVNVREGMLVALAKIGAKVRWHGEGDLIEMVPAKIRGVESYGMICAGVEIGLSGMFQEGEKEILDLTEVLKGKKDKIVGKPLAEALDLADAIFEIDNKSMTHRPDLWGHYGLSREVAAIYRREVAEYPGQKIKAGKKEKIKVSVEDKEICPRYMAVKIKNVTIKESPEWLKKSLIAVGQRPLNNIVDVTNYVMLDSAEPMHAFDATKIFSKEKETMIFVRRAKEGEKIKILDDRDLSLTKEDIVIADEQKPIALAGVMGGAGSAVDEQTKDIILEAAVFEPTMIRKTAIRFNARTDASARFEKKLDPTMAEKALNRAVELILEMCPEAEVVSNVVDVADYHLLQGPISLSMEFLRAKIGFDIEEKEVINILQFLGFTITKKKDFLAVRVPTWRATKDISIPEDLVEEVARIYGYDNIKPVSLFFPVIRPELNELRKLENETRNLLVYGLGYNEVNNYSFVSSQEIKNIKDTAEYLELDNPLSKERPFLRRHLVGGLLSVAGENMKIFDEVKIMEIGKTYLKEESGARVSESSSELLPRQDSYVGAIFCGKKMDNPFTEILRIVENMTSVVNVPLTLKEPAKTLGPMHPTRTAQIFAGDQSVGYIYEVSPDVMKNYSLPSRAAVLEINLNAVLDNEVEENNNFIPPPVYPEIERDIAFVVDKKVAHEKIVSEIMSLGSPLKKIELFDVYMGKNIAEDKKSMAYRLTYGLTDRTLTSDEADKMQEKVVKILTEKFKAEVRK